MSKSVRVGLTPTSTLVEGTNAGLKLTSQVTKPYLPSDTVDELDARITNGPFMYVRLRVRNTSASARPASAVYVGFSVADGRGQVIAVESTVAGVFAIVAAAGVTGSGWLLVAGLAGHGVKDLWQHRTQYVANTRWWPPFCATVDVVAAALLAAAILTGTGLHR